MTRHRLTLASPAIASAVAVALGAGAVRAQDPADRVTAAMTALRVALPPAAEVELALSAAPPHLRAEAAVFVFGASGFRRVRASTNGIHCLVNRDAFFYGAASFKPTCWDAVGAETYLPVMLRVGELLAAGRSAADIAHDIDVNFLAGRFKAPDRSGVAYMLAGDVAVDPSSGRVTRQLFAGHYMFYAVGATNTQLGTSPAASAADATLPVVFDGGAGGKHGLAYIIAVPVGTHRHEP